MSLFSALKLRNLGTSVYDRVHSFFAPTEKQTRNARKSRRLCIDPLEERQLLSITTSTGITIDTGSVATTSSQSIATDDNGDTVVVWTAADSVYDSDTRSYVTDYNVYAEYLTHNTQEITLATGTKSFYLVYGGSTITQTLSFAQDSTSSGIAGTVTLTFGSYTFTLSYSSSDSSTFASDLQTALQKSGDSQLAGAKVTVTDDYDFAITYTAALDSTTGTVCSTSGKEVTQTYLAVDQGNTTFSTGYLASCYITTDSEPIIIGKISVSSSNAGKTVLSLTSYLEGQSADTATSAPTDNTPTSTVDYVSTGLSVTVTSVCTTDDPYGLYHFQITFDNDSGYEILDKLQIVNAVDSSGNDVTSECSVAIIKQSSGIFRVNSTEVDDEYTYGLDVTAQYDAVVAMDGDGDFIISWVSQNSDGTSDVYARRFTTQSYVDTNSSSYTELCMSVTALDSDGDLTTYYVEGVAAVAAPTDDGNLEIVENTEYDDGSVFMVNTLTSNSYGASGTTIVELAADNAISVAMDAEGNFVIAWASSGQENSYFNQIYMRQFTADGEAVDIESLVSDGTAVAYDEPSLAIGTDDRIAIIYTRYNSTPLNSDTVAVALVGEVMSWAGKHLYDISVGDSGGTNASLTFDSGNNLVVVWQEENDSDGIHTTLDWDANGVYGVELDDTGATLIAKKRINSALTTISQWTGAQISAQAGVDADGDITIVYSGAGPDVYISDNDNIVTTVKTYFTACTNSYDSDLWSDLASALGISATALNTKVAAWFTQVQTWLDDSNYDDAEYDLDIIINDFLAQLQTALSKAGVSSSASSDLMGRVNTMVELTTSLLRGEANGVLYTQVDASGTSNYGILVTDVVANTERDGSNTTLNFNFAITAEDATIVLDLTNAYGDTVTFSFSAVFYPESKAINWDATLEALNSALNALVSTLGSSDDVASVRLLTASEIAGLAGTDWAVMGLSADEASDYCIIQITFEGSAHDSIISAAVNSETKVTTTANEVQVITFSTASTGSWASITVGSSDSADFWFDSTNPIATSQRIANALAKIAKAADDTTGTSGIIVTFSSDGLTYTVTFSGVFSGVDEDDITQAVPAAAGDDDPATIAYTGGISSTTVTSGGDKVVLTVNIQNGYVAGNSGTEQYNPSIAMEADGTFIISYTTVNDDGSTSVIVRSFTESSDTAGPTVTAVETEDGDQIQEDSTVATSDGVSYLIVDVSESLYCYFNVETQLEILGYTQDSSLVGTVSTISGLTLKAASTTQIAKCETNWEMSVLNPDNYEIKLNGTKISGAVVSVSYGFNEAYVLGLASIGSSKYQIVITIDASKSTSGNQALTAGNYTLVLHNYVNDSETETGQSGLCDTEGNPLNLTGYNQNGSDYTLSFTVAGENSNGSTASDTPSTPDSGTTDTAINTTTTGDQDEAVVATASDGSYVVVWVSYASDSSGNIIGQRYDSSGNTVGSEFTINSYTAGVQNSVSVAMNDDGSFVVTWYGKGEDGYLGIYARCYNAKGQATTAQFLVSTVSTDSFASPSVAIADSGSFAVTWREYNADTMTTYIYVRLYDENGTATTSQIQVNTSVTTGNCNPDIAMDADGDFVVVWQACSTTGTGGYDIFAQLFDANGNKVNGVLAVNSYTTNTQCDPSVAMDDAGAFVITWSSYGQTGNASYDIYARQYSSSGTAAGSAFLVNATTAGDQTDSDVACDSNGNFTVVWTSWGQDDSLKDDDGVYARMYLSNGSDYAGTSGDAVGEFRVNATTSGDQYAAAVSRNASNGDYVVVWLAADASGTGIYSRRLDPASDATTSAGGPTVSGITLSNASGTETLSWTATDDNANVSSVTLTIGSTTYTVSGPYSTSTYYSSLGVLDAGTYTYVIAATNTDGVTTTATGKFTVSATETTSGVTISDITTGTSGTSPTISWTVADSAGILSTVLLIDGVEVTVDNTTGTSYLATYSSILETVSTGTHTYTIIATEVDGGGSVSVSGTFMVANAAPTISSVSSSTTSTYPVITWSVADTTGIASVTITVDGISRTVTLSSGTTYDAVYTSTIYNLAAGTHTYSISATDTDGAVSTAYTGTFTTSTSTAVSANVSSFSGDFNNDGTSDVLWENTSTGLVGYWLVKSGKCTKLYSLTTVDTSTVKIVGVGDYNGDGISDILWENTNTGAVGAWIIKNNAINKTVTLKTIDLASVAIVGTGDYNNDGTSDILWEDQAAGKVYVSFVKSSVISSTITVNKVNFANWQIVGEGDFNKDGYTDILWQNTSGTVVTWLLNKGTFKSSAILGTYSLSTFTLLGVADVNGDGTSDILWQNKTNTNVRSWIISNVKLSKDVFVRTAGSTVSFIGAGDYNANGTTDLLWQNQSTGAITSWLMKSSAYSQATTVGSAKATGGWIASGSGVTVSALNASSVVTNSSASSVTQSELTTIVEEAIARWTKSGLLTTAQIAKLSQVTYVISDLSGSLLGEAIGNVIYIDTNAAGNSWFIDSTASSDEEYTTSSSGDLVATTSAAESGIDLLTVVEHELGHVLGLVDLDSVAAGVMSSTLSDGVRRNITASDYIDEALASLSV
jgi:hypothetical protein